MKKYYFFLAFLIGAEISIAQVSIVPDAGSVRKNIEPMKANTLPIFNENLKNEKIDEPFVRRTDFEIKKIKFIGNDLIKDEILLNDISLSVNELENFEDLKNLADKISEIYAKYGWLAKVILPEQDITDGEVYFKIIESKFAGVRHEGELPKYVELDKILEILNARQSLGAALRVNEIDRALLLADDLAGVSVVAYFSAGENEGDTLVTLRTSDEQKASGQIDVDNLGSRSTGIRRGSIGLVINSPGGIGDRFNISEQITSGGPYFRASYSRPISSDGFRFGISTSYLSYEVIASEFNSLKPSGESSSFGFDVTYPIVRSRNENLNMAMAVERKEFNNKTTQSQQSNYATQTASATLNGYFFDKLLGGGSNGYNWALTSGQLINVRLGPQTQLPAKYKKINYAITRQQALNGNLSFFANYMGQKTRQTLDSSERISIGGVNGVRAYPNGEGAADAGDLLSMELRQRLNQEWTISAFYDWGRSKRVLSSPSPYTLHGQGLWINWQSSKGVNTKFIWARRLGAHPYPSQNGKDQDGSFDLNRFWIQIVIPFSG